MTTLMERSVYAGSTDKRIVHQIHGCDYTLVFSECSYGNRLALSIFTRDKEKVMIARGILGLPQLCVKSDEVAELFFVEVHEKFRFRGYGKLLVENIVSYYNKNIHRIREVRIRVESFMPVAAVHCYKAALRKLGFCCNRSYPTYSTFNGVDDTVILGAEGYEAMPTSERDRKTDPWTGELQFKLEMDVETED